MNKNHIVFHGSVNSTFLSAAAHAGGGVHEAGLQLVAQTQAHGRTQRDAVDGVRRDFYLQYTAECQYVSCRSSEKNRYQNALTVCNVALDSVVSDIFGKSPHPLLIICLNNQGYKISLEYAIIDSPNGKREKIFNIYREVIL